MTDLDPKRWPALAWLLELSFKPEPPLDPFVAVVREARQTARAELAQYVRERQAEALEETAGTLPPGASVSRFLIRWLNDRAAALREGGGE